MAADPDLTLAILREIRDEARSTRTELKAEIAGTNARLDQTIARFDARFDQVDARLEVVEHTVRDAAGQLVILTRYVKNVTDRHDDATKDLRERVDRLETEPRRKPRRH